MTSHTPKSVIHQSIVRSRREITPGLVVLQFENEFVASNTQPGQFVNILPKIGFSDPLLRRPFSVYNITGNLVEIIIQDHGRGTNVIANTNVGEMLDVLGPLGNPWHFNTTNYKTAILVLGGVGVASMPLLTKSLAKQHRQLVTFYGARTSSLFADEYLLNVQHSTDDGTRGYHGSVIDNLRNHLSAGAYENPKLFVCGPTGMMRAARTLADEFGIMCEVSLETEMACGIGICQGCPILLSESEAEKANRKFYLVCTHGPSFEKEAIVL
ncbi:MAG: dihydroorotate dehydrogenase electron transfer subunit [bacterium]